MRGTSAWRSRSVWVLGSGLLLSACATNSEPNIGPSLEREAELSETAPDLEAEVTEPIVEAEVLPEDPVEPEPAPETFEGPRPWEIDRAIYETIGDDPMGLIQDPNDAEVLPLEMNERVESWINYFQNVIPERFGLYLERMGRFEPMMRRKLREAGMPQDLIYLSLIESGMSPDAYSRAAAVGLWQFISSTGRMYDLEISFFVDERRNPELATDAALRYLSDLHRQFGSWFLAAAAYNGGPGRVSRGLRRVEGGTFWDLADARLLRRETRDYVPKIIAAAIIGHDPERYGFDLERHVPVRSASVTIPDATSFDVIAEVAGVDEDVINDLNPMFPQNVTPPNRAVTIQVPIGSEEGFDLRYAEVPVDERVTWTFHVVRRGETLGEIGSNYGVSVTALRAANNNVNPRRLRIGQRLVVPNPAHVARSQSRAQQAGSSQSAEAAPSQSSTNDNATTTASSESSNGPVTITVQRGESLWLIARRYSVSTRQIMDWNSLSSSRIYPGDRLEIRR